jgi:3-oxoacyl-[acyl-carrier protein] reductase
MDVDLKGVFLCSKAVISQMKNRRYGKIINMASIAGKEGNANMVHYSSAKAAVICFTKALADEVASFGINVNCVVPALIDTDLVRNMDPKQAEILKNKIPLRRLGKPEEVAEVALFLASDKSSFITGQSINITGGRGKY